MHIDGHSEEKYTTGTQLLSSTDRDWSTVLAETWKHKAGDLPDTLPRDTEIAILLSGTSKVRRQGDGHMQISEAKVGTIWLCPAGIEERKIRIYDDMDEVLHIFLPASPFNQIAVSELDMDITGQNLRYEGGFQDEFIHQLGKAIVDELQQPSPVGALRIETIGACLTTHLMSSYSNVRTTEQLVPVRNGALDSRRLNRVIEYVEAHLTERITLEDLAKVSCLSRHHFARAFKKATGKTPHLFVLDRRLMQSKKLLSAGSVSLAEAALDAGFANQAHFSRVFKQRTGMTPGQYRRRMTYIQ